MSDLRDRQLPEEALAVSLLLRTHGPPQPAESELELSGFCCLAEVLRSIFSRQVRARREKKTVEEGENPILTYAWTSFSGATAGPSTIQQQLQLAKGLAGSDGRILFHSLFTAPAMHKTIWSRREFQLFDPAIGGTIDPQRQVDKSREMLGAESIIDLSET